ncbi:MAG: 23S rRNA (pseudouridine(1915)-N(3))-methyltransferase RlmH [Bacteroidota bacterium]
MKIKLIFIGKTEKKQLQPILSMYLKRLQRYARIETIEISDIKKRGALREEEVKEQEGMKILDKTENSDYLILLDENGVSMSSVEFAGFIEKLQLRAVRQVVFVVGGAWGFSKAVYQRADKKISLSSMTFSHQLIRIIFAEQLYRAFTIIKNEPYHHA